MLTISERKALHEMNGVVAKVRPNPKHRSVSAVVPPHVATSPPQSTAAAISKEPLLIRAWLSWSAMNERSGAVLYGVILGALLWMPFGAWVYTRFTTP